jgi:hypothetical protein
MNHKPWQSIFDTYKIHEHDFSKIPYILTAEQIKKATAHLQALPKEKFVFCANRIQERADLRFLWIATYLFYLSKTEFTAFCKVKAILIFPK